MAEQADQADKDVQGEQPEAAQKPSQAKKKPAIWRRFLTRRWLATLVVGSIVVHGLGFAYYQFVRGTRPMALGPEVSLGEFQFEADPADLGEIAGAKFSLHIALLEHIDQQARPRLESRRFRVQQDIEELLRRAHGGDFHDPSLGELKRQLQERINETLGMRAIADVIITDLALTRREQDLGSLTDTAESVPWVEKPSG